MLPAELCGSFYLWRSESLSLSLLALTSNFVNKSKWQWTVPWVLFFSNYSRLHVFVYTNPGTPRSIHVVKADDLSLVAEPSLTAFIYLFTLQQCPVCNYSWYFMTPLTASPFFNSELPNSYSEGSLKSLSAVPFSCSSNPILVHLCPPSLMQYNSCFALFKRHILWPRRKSCLCSAWPSRNLS